MAKFEFHDDTDTVEQLYEELPDTDSWGDYLLECVELRKKIEGRELHVTPVDTRSVDEKE